MIRLQLLSKVLNEFDWNDMNRSSILTVHYTRLSSALGKRVLYMLPENAKYERNDLIWKNIDLPSLESITSEGGSFCWPHSVTLECRWYILYWLHLDIPNVNSVNLPGSFIHTQYKSISSIFIVVNELQMLLPFSLILSREKS